MLRVMTTYVVLLAMRQRFCHIFTLLCIVSILSLILDLLPYKSSAPHLSWGFVSYVLPRHLSHCIPSHLPAGLQYSALHCCNLGFWCPCPSISYCLTVHCHVVQSRFPCYRQNCNACRCSSNQRLHPLKQGSSSRQCIKHIWCQTSSH